MDRELKSFEDIHQITDTGKEYWLARDLQKLLGYDKWGNFSKVIDRAMLACDTSGFDVSEHFPIVKKTVEMPVGEQFGSRGFPDVRKTPNTGLGFPDVGKTKKIEEILVPFIVISNKKENKVVTQTYLNKQNTSEEPANKKTVGFEEEELF
jgi:hypothetical protein